MTKCEYEGHEWFPHYGPAPHRHNIAKTGSFIGSTEVSRRETWPANFVEDPECPGLGTYYCPKCFEGKRS